MANTETKKVKYLDAAIETMVDYKRGLRTLDTGAKELAAQTGLDHDVARELLKRKMGAAAFTQVIGYRNLDELTDRIDRFSYRVLKKDCLDLPEKIYTVRYVGMSDEQFKYYEQIRNHAMVLFDNGEMTTAPL